jgi:hypothetical protein
MLTDDAEFDMFWDAYPRKTAKKDAIRAWKKLNPSPALVDKILRAIGRQRESRQWKVDAVICHPATWLNGARWEDEMEPASPLTKQGEQTKANLSDWLASSQSRNDDAPRIALGQKKM